MYNKEIIKKAFGIISILIDIIILINILLLSILQKAQLLLGLSLIKHPMCARESLFASSIS